MDGDVRRRATSYCAARGLSLREGLNELVRLGLVAQQQPPTAEPFQIKPRRMGLLEGYSYDDIGQLIETAEGPRHR